MKMYGKAIALSLILLMFLMGGMRSALAEYWSTVQLMEWLEQDLHGHAGYNSGLVTGYVVGVADAFEGITSCIPSGVSVKETKQVVYTYMANHPEALSSSPEVVMMDALSASWPCVMR